MWMFFGEFGEKKPRQYLHVKLAVNKIRLILFGPAKKNAPPNRSIVPDGDSKPF
jgi:hypothetical protein